MRQADKHESVNDQSLANNRPMMSREPADGDDENGADVPD
jgi:hypothetical protein